MFIPFAVLIALATPPSGAWADPLMITGASVHGRRYAVYIPVGDNRLVLMFTPPERNDARVRLAIAGTYTDARGAVDGCAVIQQRLQVHDGCKPWRGVLQNWEGNMRMLTLPTQPTPGTNIFSAEYLSVIPVDAVQVHALVIDGTVQPFSPQPAFQRRAYAILQRNDHTFEAIVESAERMDLTTFARDLVALDVSAAVNLDMGALALGWIRDPMTNEVRSIGTLDGKRVGQSNWIVLRAP